MIDMSIVFPKIKKFKKIVKEKIKPKEIFSAHPVTAPGSITESAESFPNFLPVLPKRI
jgi:hypothetical protein